MRVEFARHGMREAHDLGSSGLVPDADSSERDSLRVVEDDDKWDFMVVVI